LWAGRQSGIVESQIVGMSVHGTSLALKKK
jgi:hypothetical protein